MTASRPARQRLNTVREVCQEYLARATVGKTGRGWQTARIRINEFVTDKGDILVDDLIGDDLEKWIEDRPRMKSSWSKKNIAQTIKRPFSWAWNKGLIGSHPLKGVSYTRGERGKPMSEEQFRMILRNVGADFRRILFFLWWTGCRPSELCALEWTFIDTETATAVLREHKTAHSSKEPRTIYLPEKAVRLLLWILADQRKGETVVFLNQYGKRCNRHDLTRRVFRARQRLGIPPSVKLYGCRHHFITQLLVANVPLKTVSMLAGHSSVATTEIYAHLAGETTHMHNALETGLAKPKDKP